MIYKYLWIFLTVILFELNMVIVIQAETSDASQQLQISINGTSIQIDSLQLTPGVETSNLFNKPSENVTNVHTQESDLTGNDEPSSKPESPKEPVVPVIRYNSSQLYVFGGKAPNGDYLASASHYNSSTGRWRAIRSMAVPKAGTCGVVIGTKIYLFGGSTTPKNPVDQFTNLNTAEVYDIETDTYSPYRSLPEPRGDCSAAVLGDFIYVAGGMVNKGYPTSVLRYNIHTTVLENVSPVPNRPLGTFKLIVLAGRLYGICAHKKIFVYNPADNKWTAVAGTRYSHMFFQAAAHEGKIYVFSDPGPYNRRTRGLEAYSPDTNQWNYLTWDPQKPPTYIGSTLVSMNNKLWTLGGIDNRYSKTSRVLSYDTVTNNDVPQRDMDVARSYHSTFVVNH